MTTESAWFRNSRKSILADYLSEFPKMVALVMAVALTQASPGTSIGQVLAVVGTIYLVVLLVEPPVRYSANRYAITPEALLHDRGVTHRTMRAIPWESVSACQVDTPWAHRMLGLHRVTVSQADGEEARVVIRGVQAPVVDAVQRRLTGANETRTPQAPSSSATGAPHASRTLIHRAGWGELAVMSLAHGQAVVLGLALVMSVWEFADQFGLLGVVGVLVGDVPIVVRGTVGAALALAGGVVATLVRYHDFRIERLADGTLVSSYGLFARRERRFEAAAVRGLIVHRNPVELAVGRARLGVLTRDSEARMSGNMVIPSAPLATVEAVALAHFGHLAQPFAGLDEQLPRRAAGLGALIVAPAAMLGYAAFAQGLRIWVVLVTVVAAWLLTEGVVRLMSTDFAWDGDRDLVHITTRSTHFRRTSLRRHAVHAIGSTAWRSVPDRRWLAWLGAYAGQPRRYIALRPNDRDIRAITQAITSYPSHTRETLR